MLRAQQVALEESAVQQLLTIREKELQLQVDNYRAFSTQSALIAGFMLTALTNIDPTFNASKEDAVADLFFIFTSVGLTAAVAVIVVATVLGVLGPALALRGPQGSMVTAVDILQRSRKSVFIAFFVTVLSFCFSGVFLSWMLMNTEAAVASTIFLLVGIWITFARCRVLYSRLRVREDTMWEREGDCAFAEAPCSLSEASASGYLTRYDLRSKSWRREFVVLFRGGLYLYISREAFQRDTGALRNRPIRLEGTVVETPQVESGPNGGRDSAALATAGPYELHIVSAGDAGDTFGPGSGPSRELVRFRVDTLEELDDWAQILNDAIRDSNRRSATAYDAPAMNDASTDVKDGISELGDITAVALSASPAPEPATEPEKTKKVRFPRIGGGKRG